MRRKALNELPARYLQRGKAKPTRLLHRHKLTVDKPRQMLPGVPSSHIIDQQQSTQSIACLDAGGQHHTHSRHIITFIYSLPEDAGRMNTTLHHFTDFTRFCPQKKNSERDFDRGMEVMHLQLERAAFTCCTAVFRAIYVVNNIRFFFLQTTSK